MSWYNLWDNWLNTTIRCCDHNQNNVGFYFFKSNSYRDKAKYFFGSALRYSHKMNWHRKHRGRRTAYISSGR